jgi:cell wall assembly regulator SMI1
MAGRIRRVRQRGGLMKPRPTSTKTLLTRLSELWALKRPGFEERLRPGASPASLARFQRVLGTKLPRGLLALYAWHDGARDHAADRLETCGWMPLRKALETKKMLDTTGFEDETIYPKYAWSLAWVPFLESDGDTVCVDTKSGVVFERHNDTSVVLLAPSFAAWLAAHVAITEAIRVKVGEDAHDQFFQAFNGGIDARVRRKVSPGYPKRPANAKCLF